MSEPEKCEPEKYPDSVLMELVDEKEGLHSARARRIILDLLETRKQRDEAISHRDYSNEVGRNQDKIIAGLMNQRDEAIAGMNHNAEAMADAAQMCREARHVADLTLAVLKTFTGFPRLAPLMHFVRAIEGKYSWLITGRLDYQPEEESANG